MNVIFFEKILENVQNCMKYWLMYDHFSAFTGHKTSI